MPDNSRRDVYQHGLPPGRKPSGLLLVPYRIEEQCKGRRYILPEGKDGPKSPVRGPPIMGPLRIYIGDETKPDVKTNLPRGRTVEQGFALNRKDAQDRLIAYIRRHQLAQASKMRRRARGRSGKRGSLVA